MIVGVDPNNTDLSQEERDNIVIKSLIRLQITGWVKEILKWEDGFIQITFCDGEGYEYDFYMRDGLVHIEDDGKNRSLMKYEKLNVSIYTT